MAPTAQQSVCLGFIDHKAAGSGRMRPGEPGSRQRADSSSWLPLPGSVHPTPPRPHAAGRGPRPLFRGGGEKCVSPGLGGRGLVTVPLRLGGRGLVTVRGSPGGRSLGTVQGRRDPGLTEAWV